MLGKTSLSRDSPGDPIGRFIGRRHDRIDTCPNEVRKLWIYLEAKKLKAYFHASYLYTSIAEVMGSIPVQAWIFFRLAFSSTA